MDWSLVLMSQGIESTIEAPAGESGWQLALHEKDYRAAIQVIKNYRVENRGWAWARRPVTAGLLFDWTSAAWILLLIFFHLLSNERPAFFAVGIFDGSAFKSGDWWRIVTAMTLHADLKHLAANSLLGFILLGLIMGFYGTGVGLSAAFLAGIGGNLLSLLVYSESHRGVGASGMITGCLGLLAAQWFVLTKGMKPAGRMARAGIASGILLFVMFGFSPGTDIVAHAGGFASGLLVGGALVLVPAQRRLGSFLNLASALAVAFVLTLSWWFALHSK